MLIEIEYTLLERIQHVVDMAGDPEITVEFIVNEALEAYLQGVDEALWECENDDV